MTRRATSVNERSFLLGHRERLSSSRTRLCFHARAPRAVSPLRRRVCHELGRHCPLSIVSFSPPRAIFRGLFIANRPSVVTRFCAHGGTGTPRTRAVQHIRGSLTQGAKVTPANVTFRGRLGLDVDGRGLLLCHISCGRLCHVLGATFHRGDIAVLRSCRRCLPVDITNDRGAIGRVLRRALVRARPSGGKGVRCVPLQRLIAVTPTRSLGDVASKHGNRCIPFGFCSIRGKSGLVQRIGRMTRRAGR